VSEVKPVAWMRSWTYQGVDVMKIPKKDRPQGWALRDVTLRRFYGEDIALYPQSAIDGLLAEVDAVWQAMPNDARYLDPPDGGDVPLHEQVARMAAEAARASELEAALRVACQHIEFPKLRISHCNDAAQIERALTQEPSRG
jgi:hypothetical protein